MNTSQAIKNRLQSLRTTTEELKVSTLTTPLHLNHIKSLLDNLKNISEHPSSTSQSGNAQTYPNRLHPNPLASIPEQLKPNHSQSGKRQYTHSKEEQDRQQRYSDQQEIIELREENLRLEQKLNKLQEETRRLEGSEWITQQVNDSSKQLPFFKNNEELSVFICRYNVLEKEYHKIQYSPYNVELKLDKLVLLRKEKSSVEEFDLTTLQDVIYIDSQCMLLRFHEFFHPEQAAVSPELTSLFLKLESAEHLHKWDLSLFINYHIVNSLNEPTLFLSHFQRLRLERQLHLQKQKINEIQKATVLDDKVQKDLLQLLIRRRQDYLQVKKLIQQKLSHKNALFEEDSKMRPKEQSTETKIVNDQSPIIPRQHNREQDKYASSNLEQLDYQKQTALKQEIPFQAFTPVDKQEPVNSSEYRYISTKNQQETPFKQYESAQLKGPSILFSQQRETFTQTSPFQPTTPLAPFPSTALFPLTSPPLDYSNRLNQQQAQKVKLPAQQALNDSLVKSRETQKKVQAARANLQKGYYTTKYSKDGFSPHQKKVFLSLDCKKFCWSEIEKEKEYKSIPLEVITNVRYGVVGEGILKHVSNPDARYYCVIEYFSSDYRKKTIELGSGNQQEVRAMSSDLQVVLSSARGSGLSSSQF